MLVSFTVPKIKHMKPREMISNVNSQPKDITPSMEDELNHFISGLNDQII